MLYLQRQSYEKAIAIYEKAIELNPGLPESYFNLGYIHAAMGDFQSAKNMYAEVVQLSPPYLDEALFNLAMMQEKVGEIEGSIRSLEQALAVNADNTMVKKHLTRLKGKSEVAKDESGG